MACVRELLEAGRSLVTVIPGHLEVFKVDAGSQTQVLFRNSKCSQVLRHLPLLLPKS